jgi:hypothetical protein
MHRTPRAIAGCLALMMTLLVAGVRAEAAPRTREQREAEARKACAAGRVEAGIEVLAELLTEFSHPNYIYNQGRCYQQNGRSEQAISRFKEYLRAAHDISADERERVERFIKELEAEVQAAAPPVATPPPPSTNTEAPPATPPVSSEPVPPTSDNPPSRVAAEAPPARGAGLRTTAIALGVVAVAGLATGLVSSLQVRSLESEVEMAKVAQFNPGELTQQEEKAQRFEILQWVGYGVGAAAAAGAVVCLIMDRGEPSEHASRVRLIGTVSPGGRPGLVLAGRF